jgi:spore coat protein U-like protein
MKKLKIKILFLMSLITFLPKFALATCQLTMTTSPINIDWDMEFAGRAVQITLHKSSTPSCDYWIGFTNGSASDSISRKMYSGSVSLPYQLYKDSTFTRPLFDPSDTPITSTNLVIQGSFSEGSNLTQTLLYYFNIPAYGSIYPTLAKSGTYLDTFSINVYEGGDPTVLNAIPILTTNMTATVTIPPTIRMSVVSSGGGFNPTATSKEINFGSIYPGEYKNFDIRVFSNAGYRIVFSSRNNGKLKNLNFPFGSGVPYALFINGSLLDLSRSASSPVLGLLGDGQTQVEGLAYPVRIRIGNFQDMPASGIIEDSILITATTTY